MNEREKVEIKQTDKKRSIVKDDYKKLCYRIMNIVRNVSGYNLEELDENTRLYEDLSFDSLTMSEFCTVVEEKFNKDITEIIEPSISIMDIAKFINRKSESKDSKEVGFKYPLERGAKEYCLFKFASRISKALWNFEVMGLENVKELESYILCPNHQSHLDGLWVSTFLPNEDYKRVVSMAKKEHLNTLLGKILIKVGGGIPVDRYGNSTEAIKNCILEVRRGELLLIHPEGTRTENGKLGEFKAGAAQIAIESSTPIVPVYIKGAYEVFPKSKKFPNIINKNQDGKYLIKICFGEPIYPKNYDENKLIKKVELAVVEMENKLK